MGYVNAIDLNADLGEGFGQWRMADDAGLLQVVTSANVACGMHAGDPAILRDTVRAAAQAQVAVGAHPGWPDLRGFGRRPWIDADAAEVEAIVLYQLGAFGALAQTEGGAVRHVKLHGALAHQCADDVNLALAAGQAIVHWQALQPSSVPRAAWLVMPGSAQERACRKLGIRPIFEAYADRAYAADGRLVARSVSGAVLHEPHKVAARAVEMVRRQALPTIKGAWLPAPINSLCVHGDTPGAVEIARAVRAALQGAGLRVEAPA